MTHDDTTFPENMPIGVTHQDAPPSADTIKVVRLAQSILTQAGLSFWAETLDGALSRPVYVHDQSGWWILTSESMDTANEQARNL